MNTCPECGAEMILSTGPDRTRDYRGKPNYRIPRDLEFPACPNCGAEWMTASQIDQLSDAFEEQRIRRESYTEAIQTGMNLYEVEEVMES